jgi:hypothetical protein
LLALSLWSYIIFGAPTLLLTKRARLFVTTGKEEKVCSLQNYQNSDICLSAVITPSDEFAQALEKCPSYISEHSMRKVGCPGEEGEARAIRASFCTERRLCAK